MVASEQPKRIDSCQCPRGSTSRPGSGPTERSMTSTTGRFVSSVISGLHGCLPLAIALEMTAEPAQQHAQQRVARVDGVAGEGHARTEKGFHFGIGPASYVVGEAALPCVVEVVHPADK